MKLSQLRQLIREEIESINAPDVGGSFTKKDLFEAFSYYAFANISNQPYNQRELIQEFEKWFKHKYPK